MDAMESSDLVKEIREAIPWFLWAVWKNRNALILSNKQDNIESLAHKAKRMHNYGSKLIHIIAFRRNAILIPLLKDNGYGKG